MIELIATQRTSGLDCFKFSTLLVMVYSHYNHSYITPRPHITVYCTISHLSTWHIVCGALVVLDYKFFTSVSDRSQQKTNIHTHQKAHFTSYQTLHYKDLEVYLPIL